MVYGPQPKRTYKPRADVPRHALPSGNACGSLAPCGAKCILDGRYRHVFHVCSTANCARCHDPKRFGRMAA
jgi:hypothetical protein